MLAKFYPDRLRFGSMRAKTLFSVKTEHGQTKQFIQFCKYFSHYYYCRHLPRTWLRWLSHSAHRIGTAYIGFGGAGVTVTLPGYEKHVYRCRYLRRRLLATTNRFLFDWDSTGVTLSFHSGPDHGWRIDPIYRHCTTVGPSVSHLSPNYTENNFK